MVSLDIAFWVMAGGVVVSALAVGMEPVDCHGGPGDILFWHHRIGHAASPNTTRRIRQAVLYDYVKKEIEETQEEPPQEDMWRDWSEELRGVDLEE